RTFLAMKLKLPRYRWLLLIACLAAVAPFVVVSGCGPDSSESAVRETKRRLHSVADLVSNFVDGGHMDAIEKVRSCDEFFKHAKAHGFIDFDRSLVDDAWGRPFSWTVERTGDVVVVRIMSLGPDGISQGGQGDD